MTLGRVVLDASVVLNLTATAREVDLLGAVSAVGLMTPAVMAQVTWLYGPPGPDGTATRVSADVGPMLRAGVLETVALATRHAHEFVECAARIDDCDAESLALAGVEGLALASDDAKQRRIFAERHPELRVVSTLEIVKQAATALCLGETEVGDLLALIRTRANFAPPRSLPLREWYVAHLAARGLG